MSFRMFSVATLALAMLVGATALAAKDAEPNTHDGKVVSITGDKLVMTSKEGKEHSHTLTADAKLTLDGKACKAADLKAGTRIRVTTQGADKSVASRIEGLDKNPDFASNRHDGKVVSITGNKLVMTGTQGKEEHTCTLTADVKVTCDGKVCKSSDLKPGMRIRVTSESDDPHAATGSKRSTRIWTSRASKDAGQPVDCCSENAGCWPLASARPAAPRNCRNPSNESHNEEHDHERFASPVGLRRRPAGHGCGLGTEQCDAPAGPDRGRGRSGSPHARAGA